ACPAEAHVGAGGHFRECFSMFMYFGTHVGWRLSEALAEVSASMTDEWIWAKAAFGDAAPGREDDFCILSQYKKRKSEADSDFYPVAFCPLSRSRFRGAR